MKIKQVSVCLVHIARQKVTMYELKVFLTWLSDSDVYHASSQIIANRLGMDRSNVSKALKGLVKKEILIVFGKNEYGVTIYAVHPRFLAGALRSQDRPLYIDETLLAVESENVARHLAKSTRT